MIDRSYDEDLRRNIQAIRVRWRYTLLSSITQKLWIERERKREGGKLRFYDV